MTRKLMQEYTIKDGTTQSLMSNFMSCRQRVAYQIQGYQTKRRRTGLAFGSLIHDTLECLYKTVRAGGSRDYLKLVTNHIEAYTDVQLNKASNAGEENDIHTECMKAIAVMTGYLKKWKKDLNQKQWQEVEAEFDYVDEHGFRRRGKVDGLYKILRELWLLESKTSSNIRPAELMSRLTFDFQTLFYFCAALHTLGKNAKKLKGVLYNVIRNPGLKFRKQDTREDYIERIVEDIAKRPEHYYQRFEILITPSSVQDFQSETHHKMIEFDMWLKGQLPTYKNQTACVAPYQCEFLNLCGSGGSAVGYKKGRILFEELSDGSEKKESSTKKTSKRSTSRGRVRKVRRRRAGSTANFT